MSAKSTRRRRRKNRQRKLRKEQERLVAQVTRRLKGEDYVYVYKGRHYVYVYKGRQPGMSSAFTSVKTVDELRKYFATGRLKGKNYAQTYPIEPADLKIDFVKIDIEPGGKR